jgi:hypothetical protein
MIYQMRIIFMESFWHGEINEYIQWHDTDGNIINASDGGIIFAEGKIIGTVRLCAPFLICRAQTEVRRRTLG